MVVGVLVFTDMAGMPGAVGSVEEIQPNYIYFLVINPMRNIVTNT